MYSRTLSQTYCGQNSKVTPGPSSTQLHTQQPPTLPFDRIYKITHIINVPTSTSQSPSFLCSHKHSTCETIVFINRYSKWRCHNKLVVMIQHRENWVYNHMCFEWETFEWLPYYVQWIAGAGPSQKRTTGFWQSYQRYLYNSTFFFFLLC